MHHKRKDMPLNGEDKAFFDGFIEKYGKFIEKYAKKCSYPGIDPEDVRQETVMKLMGYVPRLRTLSHNAACSYIFHTIQTTAADIAKDATKHSYVSMDQILEETLGSTYDFEGNLSQRQALARLRNALTPREWLALVGKYGFGLSQEELGAQLRMQPDSVRMLVHRVRKRALGILSPENVTGGDGND